MPVSHVLGKVIFAHEAMIAVYAHTLDCFPSVAAAAVTSDPK